MSRKKWVVAPYDKNKAAALSESSGLDPFAALLLVSRGIEEPEAFFEELPLSDPFLLMDMDKAVARIGKALENFERIAVFGDYDADGVTAAALVYSYLESRGANAVCYIPDRIDEGYGMNRAAIQKLHDDGVKLIVTVDNGISAPEEAAFAHSLGIDMVITDHHKAGEALPEAEAVIDPQRADCPSAFKERAGVGVAFQLISALEGDGEMLLENYADLIAIGTLADVVPLTDENRTYVKKGLEIINQSPRIGVQALKEAAGAADKALSATGVAFTLAPRINAAGRMGSAMTALKLLLSEDEEEAALLAEQIDAANKKRQQIEAEITAAAVEQLASAPENLNAPILVAAGEGWHPGVIGIVAARLTERYGKPSVVISLNGEDGKGSCRSIEGFSIYDALHASSDMLTHFGGHTLAAGLGIQKENIARFREAINDYARTVDMPYPELRLDCKLNPSYIDMTLVDALSMLEPFGAGNPQPLFGLFGMQLIGIKPVGDGKHLRLTLKKGNAEITAMQFGMTAYEFPFAVGDTVDAAVRIERNEFRGAVRPSVQIRDIRFSGGDEENLLKSERLYEKYKSGAALSQKEAAFLLPNRAFLLSVYGFLQKNEGWHYDEEVFCVRSGCKAARLCTVKVAIDVLCELGLLTREGERLCLVNGKKADLHTSEILAALSAAEGE